MIAVIIVRDGVLPAGADEAICEAHRRTCLVGSRLSEAVDGVAPYSTSTWTIDADLSTSTATELASSIADGLARIGAADDPIVMPASPDGRDIAPHLAVALSRPLYAGATVVRAGTVTLSRRGGLQLVDVHPPSSFVATLQIGIRGAETHDGVHTVIEVPSSTGHSEHRSARPGERSVETVEIQPPDASTMDLAEAPRILGGGAGLRDAAAFEMLHDVAATLGASMGVTRVITDRGWAEHTRQIGTTGVVVDPDLYISFGISGAVQHTSGLGNPDHIISVNTDAHCPMMQISDVAIVADANEVLTELASLLVASNTKSAVEPGTS